MGSQRAGRDLVTQQQYNSIFYICIYVCVYVCSVAQMCPTPCDPMDCSLPVFSVRGIFQTGVQVWVAISPSRGPSRPRGKPVSPSLVGGFFTIELPGKPPHIIMYIYYIFFIHSFLTGHLTLCPHLGCWK